MTTPELADARDHSLLHLEIVELVIETIQDTFPAAATLDCHRQMRDILIRIRDTLPRSPSQEPGILIVARKIVDAGHTTNGNAVSYGLRSAGSDTLGGNGRDNSRDTAAAAPGVIKGENRRPHTWQPLRAVAKPKANSP